jgi:hypothetical protein
MKKKLSDDASFKKTLSVKEGNENIETIIKIIVVKCSYPTNIDF